MLSSKGSIAQFSFMPLLCQGSLVFIQRVSWLVFVCTVANSAFAQPAPAQAKNDDGEGAPTFVVNGQEANADGLLRLITERAKKLAAKAYAETVAEAPEELKNISQSQYRSIRFNPDAALWKSVAPYELQLFHPGFLYLHPIKLNVIDQYQVVNQIGFDRSQFIYEKNVAALEKALAKHTDQQLGFSGFRVHYPINRESYKDEMLVFQGASYFRPVGPNQVYGLSARGLAVDTGEPGGEEFPRFIEYWVIQPKSDDNQLVIGALLDSPSLSGAYVFSVDVGVNTNIEVKSKIFPRENVKKLGVAPLTSMYFFGENSNRFPGDYRPEVHDSDGLQVETQSGEWIWRPLKNPANLSITSSMVPGLAGFGLSQRDRDFNHYLDLQAHYQKRPSLWVEPTNEWGEGRVELVEIPTPNETNDNIVAYWVSNKPVKAGTELTYNYRLSSFDSHTPGQSLARVEQTRSGRGPHSRSNDGTQQFVIDFAGGGIGKLDASAPVTADIQVNQGQVRDVSVVKVDQQDRWQVAFKLMPQAKAVVDMRLSINLKGKRLSEVWNYVWTSEGIQ